MTANGFMSVSLEPALVVVSVANGSRMHGLLSDAGRYGVSVLSSAQQIVSGHFAGRPVEDLAIAFSDVDGVPVIDGALTQVSTKVVDAHPAGDHTLFIGEVQHFEHLGGDPLIFHSGAYRRLVTGLPGGDVAAHLDALDSWNFEFAIAVAN